MKRPLVPCRSVANVRCCFSWFFSWINIFDFRKLFTDADGGGRCACAEDEQGDGEQEEDEAALGALQFS